MAEGIAIEINIIAYEMLTRLAKAEGITPSEYINKLISLEVDKKTSLKEASYDN